MSSQLILSTWPRSLKMGNSYNLSPLIRLNTPVPRVRSVSQRSMRHTMYFTPLCAHPSRTVSLINYNKTDSLQLANRGLSTVPESKAERIPGPTRLGPILRNIPTSMVPYAQLIRLDKPVGTWLLLWPCTWGIATAAAETGASLGHTAWTLMLFSVGALVMRGAGCTINDLWDRNLDKHVERTATRPIASGAISPQNAIIYLGGQLSLGLLVLLSLPVDCLALGASSLIFVGTYPLFKRVTYYPQLILAFTFNWGAMLGFPAIGIWDIPSMAALYASGICWTMVYDTIYAHQDKRDDILVGIKSTALAWGDKTKPIMKAVTAAQLGFLTVAGITSGMGMPFYAAVTWAGYRLYNMISKVDLDSPVNCWKWFVDNIKTGGVIFGGIFLDYLSTLFL
ncbi:UbiA prenyltransferase family-domain-containing protein [Dipodascopsis uninucleata]